MDGEPSLIEDVVMPHAERFTDPNQPVVRRRSIGNLQQQYLRRRLNRRKNVVSANRASVGSPVLAEGGRPNQRFAVVPPLVTLHPATDTLPGFPVAALLLLSAPILAARFIVRKLVQAKDAVARAFSSRTPKKYSAAGGVSSNWRTAVWERRYVLPILLVAFIAALLLFGLLSGPGHKSNQTANKSGGASIIPITAETTAGKGGSNSKTNSSTTGSSAASSSAASGNTGGSSSLGLSSTSSGAGTTSGTGGTVGGRGGGPTGGSGGSSGGGGVTIPTCTVGQIATQVCTVPECTPAVTLQPGQKAILGLSGACTVISVN